jgi:hypothetical protein
MCAEDTEALENRYADHYLEAELHSQLKRTQLVGGPLQEFSASIHHSAHRGHYPRV